MARQERVLHRQDPPSISVVLDESVLLRRIGDSGVMREQMEHLLEISTLPHVSVRVLPLDAVHPVNTGAFIHLKFSGFDDVVYLEALYSARFVEDLEMVAGYESAYDRIRAESLDSSESRVLIQRTAIQWR